MAKSETLKGRADVLIAEIKPEECRFCDNGEPVTHEVTVAHWFSWIGSNATFKACEKHAKEVYAEFRRQCPRDFS